jgi:hypothetical protein
MNEKEKKVKKRRAEKWVEVKRTNSHRPDSMMEMNGESRRLFLFLLLLLLLSSETAVFRWMAERGKRREIRGTIMGYKCFSFWDSFLVSVFISDRCACYLKLSAFVGPAQPMELSYKLLNRVTCLCAV